ncbi:MAG: hypothetical protein IJ466_07605 [Clostridia bacterium]|nr:hypothetical protein [Clostridia bacterium]
MNRQQPGRSAYEGRFGNSQDASRRRPTGSYRSQPAGSYRSRVGYEENKRPSMRDGGDSYTRRPAPEAARQSKSRRRAKKKRGGKIAVAVIVLAAAIALILILILSGRNDVVHQLPIIESI